MQTSRLPYSARRSPAVAMFWPYRTTTTKAGWEPSALGALLQTLCALSASHGTLLLQFAKDSQIWQRIKTTLFMWNGMLLFNVVFVIEKASVLFSQLVIKPSRISVCHMQKPMPPVHLVNFARHLNSSVCSSAAALRSKLDFKSAWEETIFMSNSVAVCLQML